MTKRKIIILIILLVSLIPICAFADCSDCDVSNCEECGCEKSSNGTKCVYSTFKDNLVSCGNHKLTNIPGIIPKVSSTVYSIIQVAVPILLVLFGSIDLVKGIIAAKDDEIKKGQQLLIKRLIAGALVFFAFVIVKFVISIAADENSGALIKCSECFVEGKCD